jgi:hypothetical protein
VLKIFEMTDELDPALINGETGTVDTLKVILAIWKNHKDMKAVEKLFASLRLINMFAY